MTQAATVVRQSRKRTRTTARRRKPEAPNDYRKILVAVDGSSTSEAALAAAAALARALSGRLRVLHVVDSPHDFLVLPVPQTHRSHAVERRMYAWKPHRRSASREGRASRVTNGTK